MFKYYFLGLIDPEKSDAENYDKVFLNAEKQSPWIINIKSNGSFWTECCFCKKKSCDKCQLIYADNQKIENLLTTIDEYNQK